MMLRYSFNDDEAALKIEKAVDIALNDGLRTADIMSEGCKLVSTSEMGEAIVSRL
jgi:3-isopropylmalate dehydrogenase